MTKSLEVDSSSTTSNNNNNGINEEETIPSSESQSSANDAIANTTESAMRRRSTVYHETKQRIIQDSHHKKKHLVPLNQSGSSVSTTRASGTRRSATMDGFSESLEAGGEGWAHKHKETLDELRQRSCRDWMYTLIPMTKWLSNYPWKDQLFTDVLAGLTVGFMIIPQSMSYAKLAGLPVRFGLYASLVPIFAYALFGTSRQLAVGPVALISLLLQTGLTHALQNEEITPDNTEDYQQLYNTLALQTSFLVGLIYLLMGILRLGFVTIFLSHAVVSGFTSAAAITIGLSQLKYILGYPIPSDKELYKVLYNIFKDIDQFNWKPFVLGTSSVFILVGLKKVAQVYPRLKWTKAAGPLVVTLIAIGLQAALDLESKGIAIVGTIPKGLPAFSGGQIFPLGDFAQLAVTVFSIVIVGFMESIAIAKQLAAKHSYNLDSSMELVGLGMANLTAGLFGGYPVAGSFSRSAVNNDSGAKSGLSAMVTATVVGLVLLFLTPVFELLPLAILASIVIAGVISLVDYPEAIYLWKVHKFDFCVWMASFLGTLFLGVELGLGIAVGISLLLVILESAYPHTASLGRLPGTTEYRDVKQYPNAETYEGMVLVRIDAPLYFANAQNVREKIRKYERRAKGTLRFVVLELSPVSHVDTSALHALHEMTSYYKCRGIQLCLSNPSKMVLQRLVASGLTEELGSEHIFVSLHDAVNHCLDELDTIELQHGSTTTETSSPVHDWIKDEVEPRSADLLLVEQFSLRDVVDSSEGVPSEESKGEEESSKDIESAV